MPGFAVLQACIFFQFVSSVTALRIQIESPEPNDFGFVKQYEKEKWNLERLSNFDMSYNFYRAEQVDKVIREGCPSKWLRNQKGIVPCVEVQQSKTTISATIKNCKSQENDACTPANLTIWVGLHGPENSAMYAKPATDGSCSWEARFETSMPGEYQLAWKAVYYNGDAEFDYAKCNMQRGLAWTGGQVLASIPMDRKLYSPADACCEACTRNHQCTHYSAVKDEKVYSAGRGIPYKDMLHKCILFANSTTKRTAKGQHHEPDLDFVSGVSRYEPSTTYLQDAEIVHMLIHSHSFDTGDMELTDYTRSDCPDSLQGVVNVSIAGDEGDSNTPRRVFNTPHFGIDVAALKGQQATKLCSMQGAQRIPHAGRWLDITEEMSRRGEQGPISSTLPEYCKPMKMDEHRLPLGFLGPVTGPTSLNFHGGDKPTYYWQPYDCNYQHFSRQDLRKCLQKRNITRIHFNGDSLMCSWGTGLFATFYEILTGLNHTWKPTDNMREKEFSNHGERVFDVKCQNRIEDKGYDGGFDVFVTNFEITHRLWHYTLTEIQTQLAAEVQEIEKKMKHMDRPPKLYYMTPSPFCTEREEHITGPRALKITEWMRAELPKYGWVELDLLSLGMARCFDSTCGNDGTHPTHNVRVMMSQVLSNHICYA